MCPPSMVAVNFHFYPQAIHSQQSEIQAKIKVPAAKEKWIAHKLVAHGAVELRLGRDWILLDTDPHRPPTNATATLGRAEPSTKSTQRKQTEGQRCPASRYTFTNCRNDATRCYERSTSRAADRILVVATRY